MAPPSQPDSVEEVRSWGAVIMGAGAISMVCGLLAIAFPDATLATLALFAGINLIVLGLLSIAESFVSGKDAEGSRALAAILGVLGLIAGLAVLRRPGETLLALLVVLGIWLVVAGVVAFFRAFDEPGRGVRMAGALGEAALGVLILALPDLTVRTVGMLAGLAFLIRGALAVYSGWRVRQLAAPDGPLAAAI
jgi:uncharacterized membrane protein HdeD (DUF308 family)